MQQQWQVQHNSCCRTMVKKPPLFNAQHMKVFRAAFVLGVLVLLVGVDGGSVKPAHRNRKQDKRPKGTSGRSSSGERVMSVKLLLDPNLMPASSQVPLIGNNSLSPWSYKYTYDDSLFPPHIAQAECLRTGCLGSDGQEDMGLESKPIYHQVLVLRRISGKKRKKYIFRLESKTIKVGCTCVLPSVMPPHWV
ncbi:interleukin-17F-like [Megalops cyprinoides]|uniref:interleukin-17F-like n=1 Tax=Megalops cyprinoides TaxID=118141 RepID=UPI001863F708|nr:interleukin-17F-like [Megalops cyprinoides]